MLILNALLLAYAGMASLSLAMAKHHRQVWNRDPDPRARLAFRTLGYLALAAALVAASSASGWAIGTVTWFGLLFIAGLALVFLLAYVARAAAALALASAVASIGLALMHTLR